jgi:hypothetical protein
MMANNIVNRIGSARANSTNPWERLPACQYFFLGEVNLILFVFMLLLFLQPRGDVIGDVEEDLVQFIGVRGNVAATIPLIGSILQQLLGRG